MVIKPKTWGFLCTNAHPHGCQANVRDQIRATQGHGARSDGPQRVLVIGASTGYGLAARITAAFGFGAETLGVFSEKPPRRKRTATAGYYNAAAFESAASEAGLRSWSINGDAFSDAARERVIDVANNELGGRIDLVIYSLAAPVRRLPDSGELVYSAVKPIGSQFAGKSIDTDSDCLVDVGLEAATEAEIQQTTQVMGGEDWALWLDALAQADVLADNARTIAFSYLGPEITWPIYAHGTIGRAKQHLESTAAELRARHGARGLDARVAVMKSILTQASAAIPSIPLYLSVVYRVMKEQGVHETAIDQQNRLFRDFLYRDDGEAASLDGEGRLRLDDRELSDAVQQACWGLWPQIDDGSLSSVTDYAGYKQDFLQMFGFARPDIDYEADVPVDVTLNCMTVD